VATEFFKTAEAYGKCEVILYSPDHNSTLPDCLYRM
jgi:UDPglucose--hexose-1-phosphate uridylyltransferase